MVMIARDVNTAHYLVRSGQVAASMRELDRLLRKSSKTEFFTENEVNFVSNILGRQAASL